MITSSTQNRVGVCDKSATPLFSGGETCVIDKEGPCYACEAQSNCALVAKDTFASRIANIVAVGPSAKSEAEREGGGSIFE
eukprot:1907276-Pleurochrysis_carterae.AAC.1